MSGRHPNLPLALSSLALLLAGWSVYVVHSDPKQRVEYQYEGDRLRVIIFTDQGQFEPTPAWLARHSEAWRLWLAEWRTDEDQLEVEDR